jgi:hypothetical protein
MDATEKKKNLALRGIEPRLQPWDVAISAQFCSEASFNCPGCRLDGNIKETAFHISLVLIDVNNGMVEMSVLGIGKRGWQSRPVQLTPCSY